MSDRYPSGGMQTRLAVESQYGVTPGSPIYKRLSTMGVTMGASVEIDPYKPPGFLVPTTPLVNDDYTSGDYDGRLDFNGLVYLFSSLLGRATVTSLGNGAYQWVWLFDGVTPLRPVSYVAHSGYPASADVANGWVFNNMQVGGGRADGFAVSGNGFAKAMTSGNNMGGLTNELQTITQVSTVSGGTYKITFPMYAGGQTAAINHNANAAAVLSAIALVPGYQTGDVVVGGGPLPGTPMTLTFGGIFAGKDVALVTIDSSLLTGGGSYSPAQTTAGADAGVLVPAVPAGAVLGNFYSDTTWAGLGGTQMLHAYDMTFNIPDRLMRSRPINKSKSSDGTIDADNQAWTLDVNYGRNAVGDAQLAKLRAATKFFPRMEWVHDTLISTSAFPYRLRIDACAFYTGVALPGDVEGVSAKVFNSTFTVDETTGNMVRVELQNAMSAL